MQAQVTSYLNRALIAAQRDSVLARTEASRFWSGSCA